jgi:AraC-like DNA-binding protein/effector-binding domain-containing protein
MIARLQQVQPALTYAARHLDEDVSLRALAAQAGVSAFHLHRIFSRAAGETPKQFTLRLRLERAAALLLAGRESVLDVALSCGFQSHEVFTRAFRRRYGTTPQVYRSRGFLHGTDRKQATRHAALVTQVGPCVGLYHMPNEHAQSPMNYSITKQTLSPQPVLIVRRRIPRSAIAATIGEVLPHVFLHAQKHGIALAGLPFTRYVEMGPGLITIEPGMRVTGAAAVSSEGDVIAEMLPGGPAATAIHTGPYDQLPDVYAAIEQWILDQKLTPARAPWECYLNDPGEHPDPKDWKTEVFWPLKP